MTRLKLPIGIQTFAKLREEGCYYADKTGFALRLIEEGTHYFLSRPRRFGKSLFIDTLAELFSGNEALFQGLYAHERWDWSRRHPVIRFSFGGGIVRDPEQLEEKIREQLAINQASLGVVCTQQSIGGCFSELIREAHAATGQRVVVLVDEYDKPILDNLSHPEAAVGIRDGLRNLYSEKGKPGSNALLCSNANTDGYGGLFNQIRCLRNQRPHRTGKDGRDLWEGTIICTGDGGYYWDPGSCEFDTPELRQLHALQAQTRIPVKKEALSRGLRCPSPLSLS